MKSVFISTEVKRVGIVVVMKVIGKLMNADSQPGVALSEEFAGSKPELKKDMQLAGVKLKFLSFCHDRNILPLKTNESTVNCNYEGDAGQDEEFDISVEEFKLFARLYGINVVSDDKYGSGSVTSEVKDAGPSTAVIRLLPRSSVLSPSGEEIEEEELWDSEVDEAFSAGEERRKAQLKKKIPGKLPKINIGKLAVAIAWEIKVDTGRRAEPKEVMNRLCKLAAKASKPDWLLDADFSVLGQEKVGWSTTEGLDKGFNLTNCRSALRNWEKSLTQKRVK